MTTVKTTVETATTADEVVKVLMGRLNEKKLAIANAKNPCWQTSGQFGYSPNSAHDRINLQIITDVKKLVEMHSFLKERAKNTLESAKELEVQMEFKWLGFTLEEWQTDIKTRVDQLQIAEKRRELDELEKRVNALISPEMRKLMELEELTKLLG